MGTPPHPGDDGSQPLLREVLPSKSPHVQLALVHVPGPAHVIEPAPYWRLTFNIGPSFTVHASGEGVRERFAFRRHGLLVIPPEAGFAHRATEPRPASRRLPNGRLATFRISRELMADCAAGLRARAALPPHKVVPTDEVLRLQAQALLCDLRTGNPDGAVATERTAAGLVTRLLLRELPARESGAARVLERVQAHVAAHLAAPISVHELADVAGLSVFHFSRVFSDAMGITPHRYILEQRIAQAQRQLWAHPDMSMLEVGLACGFASPSHFAAQFKRRTGCTPLQWRRAHGSGFPPDGLPQD